MDLTTLLIHLVVLVGISVVLPWSLGTRDRWWFAALLAAFAMIVPRGAASAACAAVWLVIALVGLGEAVAALRPGYPAPPTGRSRWQQVVDGGLVSLIPLLVSGWAVVAASAFVLSRLGWTVFDIGEPIVELTAVHFMYAGVGALTLAGLAAKRHGRAGFAALVLTAIAPPIVATGFVTRVAVLQIGGAVVMSGGALLIATLHLALARRAHGRQRLLLVLSGVAPWVPMVLAVAWATSLYVEVPALDVPAMARTHGPLNAVFVVAGLAAFHGRTDDDLATGPRDGLAETAGAVE